MKDFDANCFWNVYKYCVSNLTYSYFSLKVIAALDNIVFTLIDKIPIKIPIYLDFLNLRLISSSDVEAF